MAMPKNGFIGFQKIQKTKYAMNEVFEEEGAIKEAFSSIGQDQVFRFWKELNLKEKEYLLQSLKEISTEECETAWNDCLLYTSPSPRDLSTSRMPSSA